MINDNQRPHAEVRMPTSGGLCQAVSGRWASVWLQTPERHRRMGTPTPATLRGHDAINHRENSSLARDRTVAPSLMCQTRRPPRIPRQTMTRYSSSCHVPFATAWFSESITEPTRIGNVAVHHQVRSRYASTQVLFPATRFRVPQERSSRASTCSGARHSTHPQTGSDL